MDRFFRILIELAHLHARRIFTIIAFLLVGALSFEGGFLFGRDRRVEPLVIGLPSLPCVASVASTDVSAVSNDEKSVNNERGIVDASNKNQLKTHGNTLSVGVEQSQKCAFVGSKNSDKYHLPSCSHAKRIKSENVVCFVSAEDAQSKGYAPGCIQ